VHTPTTIGVTIRGVTTRSRPARPRGRGRRAVLAWALWGLVVLAIPALVWLDHLLRRAGRPDLAPLSKAGVVYLLGAVSAATVGAVLASRRPRHPVGWLLLALGLLAAAHGVASGYANYGLLAQPGALPGADYAAAGPNSSPFDMATCIAFVLLLTPTGSLPSPRWRWWARVVAAAAVAGLAGAALGPFEQPYDAVGNPLAVAALAGPLRVASFLAFVVTALAVPLGGWSLVVRFRHASGVERQQLRWLAFAAALAAAAVLVMAVLVAVDVTAPLGWLTAGCVALLPLATGAAILRYRLYDLDRLISRTLAYGLLTVLLGGGYAGVVLGLGQLVGRDSSLLVAGATLAVAAAFQPARRRVQQAVDRRFDRRRYDAARTIAGFSVRLRQQLDLDALTDELLAAVDQTMQPTQASLWLRPTRHDTMRNRTQPVA
jgi:hypothetical protein